MQHGPDSPLLIGGWTRWCAEECEVDGNYHTAATSYTAKIAFPLEVKVILITNKFPLLSLPPPPKHCYASSQEQSPLYSCPHTTKMCWLIRNTGFSNAHHASSSTIPLMLTSGSGRLLFITSGPASSKKNKVLAFMKTFPSVTAWDYDGNV